MSWSREHEVSKITDYDGTIGRGCSQYYHNEKDQKNIYSIHLVHGYTYRAGGGSVFCYQLFASFTNKASYLLCKELLKKEGFDLFHLESGKRKSKGSIFLFSGFQTSNTIGSIQFYFDNSDLHQCAKFLNIINYIDPLNDKFTEIASLFNLPVLKEEKSLINKAAYKLLGYQTESVPSMVKSPREVTVSISSFWRPKQSYSHSKLPVFDAGFHRKLK